MVDTMKVQQDAQREAQAQDAEVRRSQALDAVAREYGAAVATWARLLPRIGLAVALLMSTPVADAAIKGRCIQIVTPKGEGLYFEMGGDWLAISRDVMVPAAPCVTLVREERRRA